MAIARPALIRFIHKVAAADGSRDVSDRKLLEEFLSSRDAGAFSSLVRRHGSMVYHVCLRILSNEQDAEDAFQATFLVLSRKAASIKNQESVASWLFGVANHIARNSKRNRERRSFHESQTREPAASDPLSAITLREAAAILNEEMACLRDDYRAPLVLCNWEGLTRDEAATQLGWTLGELKCRLAKARKLLRQRLAARGLTLPGVFFTSLLVDAALPSELLAATVKSATGPETASKTALVLADAFVKGIAVTKLGVTAVFTLIIAAAVATGVYLASGSARETEIEALSRLAPEAQQEPALTNEEAAKVDDLAQRMWAVLNVVEKNHLQPPKREEVLLKTIPAFLKACDTSVPVDLARRIGAVDSEEKLRTLLREIWPKASATPTAVDAKRESLLFDTMFASIPGKPHLISGLTVKIDEQLRGNRYVGSGVQLGANQKEKLVEIAIPFPRGPARKAGALPGDLILEIDGKSTLGVTDPEQIAKMLRGPEGTSVMVVVRQPEATKTRTLKVIRAVIPIDSVFGLKRKGEDDWDYVLDKESQIGYVWLRSIKASTLHELRTVEQRLQAAGARALVVDFRFSRGDGLLQHAGLIASSMIDGGLMWTAREAHDQKEWHANRDPLFRDWPMAVLINDIEDNAQGAVLVALQDRGRAVLVGEPTKADGAIRRMFELPKHDGRITVLTGQLERTDKKRTWPVLPDRSVELTKTQRSAIERWLMSKQQPVLPSGTDDSAPEDPQLEAAVKVLRDALRPKGDRPKGSK